MSNLPAISWREQVVYSVRNAGKGSAKPRPFTRFSASYTYYLYASTVHKYCIFTL